ncbi:ESX secretion-associated protein EspG [Actinokineospora sp. UTMC 2448]|uniref:ESX secretion-associated protein EspG n=1 Tax=Actinokineospora sp. UTMC 2448 TaxID=2268449 RepID=UPI00216413EE|nr:ESX secretion-associated protein EspG [Actinokineospora sp. UTMC 2448]UVS78770.1 hypothetical protein Actkin_02506 [Actinokineospora sp. UTMC 2448]
MTGFALVELDLLATHAGVPVPFPLRVPSFGRSAEERADGLAAAGRALAARGLADDHGPRGLAADLVTALRGHRGTVDLVVVGTDTATAVVALVCGTWALVCRQSFTGEPGPVTVRRVPQTALTDELTGAVADVPGASTLPIALPPGVVNDAVRLIHRDGDNDHTRAAVRGLIRDRGGDPDAITRLTGLLPAVTGRGQVGATRTGERAGAELSWLDSPSGRVRIDQTTDGWTSVNPLRPAEFRLAAAEAVQFARGQR